MEAKYIIRGLKNKASGENCEKRLDAVFSRLAADGVCNIQKTPEPMRVVGRGARSGTFNAVYTQQAQPDYQGTMRGGRSVVLEAKFTSTEKIALSRISDEQAKQLDIHLQLGALCGVICCFSGQFAFITWQDWKTIPARCGHRHLTAADAQRMGCLLTGEPLDAFRRILTHQSSS